MFKICKYEESFETIWDSFVMEQAINGTFLQTRRFLNYHPKQRFVDCSLVIYNEKDVLCAVVPACEIIEDGRKIFFSHKGSTFGGILLVKKVYRAKYLIPLLAELVEFWKENNYNRVVLKNTSSLFCNKNMHLLEYAMQYSGFREYKELSTYVTLDEQEDILSHFSKGKRGNVHNCIKQRLVVRELTQNHEVEEFYGILCENLKKYNTLPVHSLEELLELWNVRLNQECGFFGCFMGDKMIAGSMMFYFNNVSVAHTQYLAALGLYNKLSPMTFVYYSMIQLMRDRGFHKLSWGIVTEDTGNVLNMGLITSKEDFGSDYCNNLCHCMDIDSNE